MGLILVPASRLEQPTTGRVRFNRQNPLGAALDEAWLGRDVSGRSISGRLTAAPPSGAQVKAAAPGLAITHTGTTGTAVAFSGGTVFPYIQVGFGYFLSSGGNYEFSSLTNSGGGYTSQIRLSSSTAVEVALRFNFGTLQTLPLTVGSGVSGGKLLCMIFQVFSATNYRLYCNGLQANGTTSPGTFGSLNRVAPPGGNINGGVFFSGFGFGRALTDAQALAITANPQLIWDALTRSPSLIIWAPAAAGAAALAGDAQAIASASGAISVSVPLAGAAIGVATASGALSTAMPLSGVSAAVASAGGTLTLGIAISGAALASASASGQMQIAIALSGSAIAQAAASGALSISGGSALAGSAVASVSASGALSIAVPLAGAAQVVASATGNLTTGSAAALAGAAVSVTAASGALTVTVSMSGAAVAQAVASGGMRLQVPLSGSAVVQAMASGAMGADAATIYARRNSAKHIAHTGRPASLSTGRRAWHS